MSWDRRLRSHRPRTTREPRRPSTSPAPFPRRPAPGHGPGRHVAAPGSPSRILSVPRHPPPTRLSLSHHRAPASSRPWWHHSSWRAPRLPTAWAERRALDPRLGLLSTGTDTLDTRCRWNTSRRARASRRAGTAPQPTNHRRSAKAGHCPGSPPATSSPDGRRRARSAHAPIAGLTIPSPLPREPRTSSRTGSRTESRWSNGVARRASGWSCRKVDTPNRIGKVSRAPRAAPNGKMRVDHGGSGQ
jgi:hypothetical protein